MPVNVVMPQMGESVAEGTVVRWIKKIGDAVERDEPLFEISTDKVDAEIPSPAAGTLTAIHVAEGQTVPVDTVVAIIAQTGEATAAATPAVATPAVATPAVATLAVATPAAAPSAAAAMRADPAQTDTARTDRAEKANGGRRAAEMTAHEKPAVAAQAAPAAAASPVNSTGGARSGATVIAHPRAEM